jgi:hypothetical protein
VADTYVAARVRSCRVTLEPSLVRAAACSCLLTVAVLVIVVQAHAGQWFGERGQHASLSLVVSSRVLISETAQLLVLLATSGVAVRGLRQSVQRSQQGRAQLAAALVAGALLAPLAALGLGHGANDVAAAYLLRGLPSAAAAARALAGPPPAPAVSRALWTPPVRDPLTVKRAESVHPCATALGAQDAGIVAGNEGRLLVIEQAVTFPDAADAQRYLAATSCAGSAVSPGFVWTVLPLARVPGVSDARAASMLATGRAAHGDVLILLQMRVGAVALSASVGVESDPYLAPTAAEAASVERVLAAAAG